MSSPNPDTLTDPALPWYPAAWARRPPGMPWDDWQAWEPWMKAHGREWADFTYNVRLPTGDPPTAIPDPTQRKLWIELNAKRIDAVGRRRDHYTIFEARRRAGWSAVGQLLGYRDLWYLLHPALDLEGLYLVAETIDDATRALARRHGITTWTVGEV